MTSLQIIPRHNISVIISVKDSGGRVDTAWSMGVYLASVGGVEGGQWRHPLMRWRGPRVGGRQNTSIVEHGGCCLTWRGRGVGD